MGALQVSDPAFFSDGGPVPTPPGWQFARWTFDSNNRLSSVANTDITPGATTPAKGPDGISGTADDFFGAAPGGDVGLFKNTLFLTAPIGFLAPTVGSAAGSTYGVGQLMPTGNDAFSIFMPAIEAQWAGGVIPIGRSNGGVTLDCTGMLTGDVHCTGEKLLALADDSQGYSSSYFQLELSGTIVPIPATAWLFASGLTGLMGLGWWPGNLSQVCSVRPGAAG